MALHDIANRRHAEKALEAGVDGVIAVAGGAGGHTGTINPFALMNEVRQLGDHFAIVLAGGLTTGRDVLAAETMGADLAYIGTRFIATREAMAAEAHKRMILDTRATDVFFTASIDGAPANWLTPSLLAAGIDLDVLRRPCPARSWRRRRTRSAGRTSTRRATASGTSTTCRPRPSSAGAWSRSTARRGACCLVAARWRKGRS